MTKTVNNAIVSSIEVANKEHANRLLTITLCEEGKETDCMVSVRLPVLGGEWNSDHVEAIKLIAPTLFDSYKMYDPNTEIELLDENDVPFKGIVLQAADGVMAEEAYKLGVAVYHAVRVSTEEQDLVEVDRLPSEARAKQIRLKMAIRQAEYKGGKYNSFFDFHMPNMLSYDNVRLINILESDYNTTGYLDGLGRAELPGEVGSEFIGMDRYHRRVLVIKGERNNNVVLFERYTIEPGKPAVVVSNSGNLYSRFIPSGAMNEDAFLKAIDLVKNLSIYSAALQKQEPEQDAE